MPNLAETLSILEPYPGIYAYYDGRVAGRRLHSGAENWLDDGAYKLGTATYSLVEGSEAIVYDTHMSLDHASAIRAHLAGLGVTKFRVVLSHWHTDHVAGNAVFADCEIIANRLTVEALHANRQKLEASDPPIKPVVMPTRTFVDRLVLTLGSRTVELLQFDIHSADGTVLFLRDAGILFAGDTVEDTITYISEPEYIANHIRDLDRLAGLPIQKILPDHGSRDVIAAGGYPPSLIAANRDYLARLTAAIDDPALDVQSLQQFVADDIASGRVGYFAPYEDVHRANIAALRGVAGA